MTGWSNMVASMPRIPASAEPTLCRRGTILFWFLCEEFSKFTFSSILGMERGWRFEKSECEEKWNGKNVPISRAGCSHSRLCWQAGWERNHPPPTTPPPKESFKVTMIYYDWTSVTTLKCICHYILNITALLSLSVQQNLGRLFNTAKASMNVRKHAPPLMKSFSFCSSFRVSFFKLKGGAAIGRSSCWACLSLLSIEISARSKSFLCAEGHI